HVPPGSPVPLFRKALEIFRGQLPSGGALLGELLADEQVPRHGPSKRGPAGRAISLLVKPPRPLARRGGGKCIAGTICKTSVLFFRAACPARVPSLRSGPCGPEGRGRASAGPVRGSKPSHFRNTFQKTDSPCMLQGDKTAAWSPRGQTCESSSRPRRSG